eukprot:1376435-Amorphochlora_amoeboformis.AAC.1
MESTRIRRRMGVPRDVIQKAVDKGLRNDKDTDQHMSLTYEGFGPEGVAVIVETITDNKNRTIAEVRHIFDKNGGNMVRSTIHMLMINCPLWMLMGCMQWHVYGYVWAVGQGVVDLQAHGENRGQEVQGALEKASGLDLTAEFVTIPTTT